ncbi:MAG: hypothetical protein KYX66_21625 [Blastomonas fulva]|uniref:DUF2231 domain-containing protein n=1 Tax=Blastomonas fulva TaxID=1550728 RepID=UPI0024E1D9FF|nr:DUF2231 domain-containing protein [Blastomonas fulva]MDK2759329.1 hypothetical protein [Blastomonas fulva]
MRTSKLTWLAAALALGMAGPLLAHEDHDAIGAGPGKTEASQPAENGDHAAMNGNMMGGADAAMGRDVAADDMAMGHGHDEAAAKNKTLGQRLVSWLGRLHTVVIHFPIALIIGAFAVELFGLWRRKPFYRDTARVMLVVGALGAIIAASLGWFAGGFYLTDRNSVLMTHRWLGTSLALLSILLVYLAFRARREVKQPRTAYWGLLGAMTIAIAVQGWLGGSFMHGGLDHLAF